MTYIPTGEGWLYLAVVLDLHSRKVVGLAMRETMAQELTIAALQMAIAAVNQVRDCCSTRIGEASMQRTTTAACWPNTACSAR